MAMMTVNLAILIAGLCFGSSLANSGIEMLRQNFVLYLVEKILGFANNEAAILKNSWKNVQAWKKYQKLKSNLISDHNVLWIIESNFVSQIHFRMRDSWEEKMKNKKISSIIQASLNYVHLE